MKRFVLAAALAAICLAPALAADLPARPRLAAAVPLCTVTSCQGFYFGMDVTGINSNLDVLGGGLAGSFGAGGTMVGAHVGYQLWNGTLFGAVEAGCAYDITQKIGNLGVGLTDRLMCTEVVKIGGTLSTLLGAVGLGGAGSVAAPAPSQGPIPFAVPAAIGNALVSPYLILGAAQKHQKNGFVAGAGAKFLISANWDASLDYMHVNYDKPGIAPGVVLDTENLVRLSLNYHFGR